MECNIGAKGKVARLKLGLMALAGALALSIVILGGFVEGTIWWYADTRLLQFTCSII